LRVGRGWTLTAKTEQKMENQIILKNSAGQQITRGQFFAAYPNPSHAVRNAWRNLTRMRNNQKDEWAKLYSKGPEMSLAKFDLFLVG
jgi:hypothetical protein